MDLLESLLWRKEGGYWLLEEHLERLGKSAGELGYAVEIGEVRLALEGAAAGWEGERKVRLLLGRGGGYRVEDYPMDEMVECPRLGFAVDPVRVEDLQLYHKTMDRRIYEEALASRPDCDDVVLWNGRGEVTEASAANLVFEIGGRKVTPPVACGLLPGTFRHHLLEAGEIQEEVVSREAALAADAVHLINSVRGWRRGSWAVGER